MTTTTTTTQPVQKWNLLFSHETAKSRIFVGCGVRAHGLDGYSLKLTQSKSDTGRVAWRLDETHRENGYPELRKVASGTVRRGGYYPATIAAEQAIR